MSSASTAAERRGTPRWLRITLKVLCILLVTAILGLFAGYGLLYVLIKGPSPSVSRLVVRSLHETRRGMHVPELYLSQQEIDDIISIRSSSELEDQDTSLITTPAPSDAPTASPDPNSGSTANNIAVPTATPSADDGIEIIDIKRSSFTGVMMIVHDASRMFLGMAGDYSSLEWGRTLPEIIASTSASGGINAGGFVDESGRGSGATPMGLVINNGELVWGSPDTYDNIVGFDSHYVLRVGYMSGREALRSDIQFGVSFGPVLVLNGKPANLEWGGVNPRSAIGQRADGAVLLLVVNGRTLDSFGANYTDMTNLMLEFGAVNACNLDGGSSSILMYNGEILNVCPSMRGPRPIPTAFMVR